MNRLHKCPCVQVCVRVWWCSNSTKRSRLWPWWYITLNNRGGNAMEKDESWDCEHTLTALGFRSAALSEQQQYTLLAYATCRDKHRHTALLQVLKIWSAPLFVMGFFPHFMITVKTFPPSTGAWGSTVASISTQRVTGVATPFKKEKSPWHRARLLSSLSQNVSWHKALALVSAHSHCTANKCDLLYFPPTSSKKKEKLNSPLPRQLK